MVDRREQNLSWAQELALQLKMKAVRFAGSLLKHDDDLTRLRLLTGPLRDELTKFLSVATPNKTYAYCLCTVP